MRQKIKTVVKIPKLTQGGGGGDVFPYADGKLLPSSRNIASDSW